MFTYIHLENLKRFAGFPYPVAAAGQMHRPWAKPSSCCYTNLEICLRLSGNDGYAVDEIDGVTFRTPYPHVLYKMAGLRHYFHLHDHREVLFFIYSAETMRRLESLGLLPVHPLQPVALTGELTYLLQRLRSLMAVSEDIGSADRIDLACFAILEELFFQRSIKCSDMNGRIRKIASLLQMDAEKKPDIIRIAADNGLSERSFYRQWKKVFSVSPAQYVMEQKMKRASWLLTASHMRIGDIASMLHFCDDNSFSNAFKRFYGITPRESRKNTVSPVRTTETT